MTRAEKLARRMHALANEFWRKHPRAEHDIREFKYLKLLSRAAYRHVARGVLRDQEKKKEAKP